MRPFLSRTAACGLALALGAGVARADTRTLHGVALDLTLATDEDVTIEADPGLSGAVRVVGDQLDCLRTNDGMAVSISSSACDSDAGHLAIMVPPAMPLSVEVAASGNVNVGDLKGPLKVTLSGNGDLKLRHASVLQLEIRGSGDATIQAVDGVADIAINGNGDVRIMHLAGPLKARQNGSGDLAIARIASPAADIETHGSGDTLILDGHVDFLRARTSGSGDVVMGGTAGTAELEASGGGDIGLGHADGTVSRHASGGSTINVGGVGQIAASAMRKLRASVSGNDDADDGDDAATSGQAATRHHHNGFHDFLAGLVVLGLLFGGWRIIGRRGGFGRLGRAFGGQGQPAGRAQAAPGNPGVIALCDLLAGLERRLARVETHVTSREFELNRKFRDIEAGH